MAKLTIEIGAKIDALKNSLSKSVSSVKSWSRTTKRDVAAVGDEGKKTAGIFSKMGDALRKPVGLGKIKVGLAGLTAGIGALVAKSVQLAANFEQTRISFDTMLGDSAKGGAMLEKLIDFSRTTPFTPEQAQKAGKTLLAFGFAADDVIPTMRTLGDVAAGTGKDFTELAIIFGQIKGAGRLMGQDLMQLRTAGFDPLNIISQKTGKSMGRLKEEMRKGLISFQDVEDAFKTATTAGGLFNNLMEKQSKSLAGRLSTLKGTVEQLAISFGTLLMPVMKPTAEWFNKTADAMTEVDAASKSLNRDGQITKLVFAEWLKLLTPNTDAMVDFALGLDKIGNRAKATAEELAKATEEIRKLQAAQEGLSVTKDIAPSIDVGGPLFSGLQESVSDAVEANERKKRAAGLGFTDTGASILKNAEDFLSATKSDEEQKQTFARQMAIERQDLSDMQKRASVLQSSIGAAFQPGGKIQSRLARIGGERTINVDRQIPMQQLEELRKIKQGIDVQTERISRLDFQQRFPD